MSAFYMPCHILSFLKTYSDDGEDDFEVVPQEPDDDVDMWDVDNDDEDEVKNASIKCQSVCIFCSLLCLLDSQRMDLSPPKLLQSHSS